MISEHHDADGLEVRVVVVDDHEMILESIVRLLAADSRIVVVGTALTAADGIEAVLDVTPDVLVIDYHLPDMDAPEAIRLIREYNTDVQVVTLSGSESPGAEEASIKAGSVAWVRKTRAIHELRDAIILAALEVPVVTTKTARQPTLDELVVHYQPIVMFDDGRIVGVEALVRWQHPDRGLLFPDEFLPLAAETGYIEVVDQWVREQAFRQLAKWQNLFPTTPRLWLGVNLSGDSVTNLRSVASFAQLIADTGVNPRDVIVEINESVLVDEPESTTEFLTQLNNIGVRLALEEFGRSFSPIAYIHRIPFDCLKIDPQFTADLPESLGTVWLIECIAKFAGSMGMLCVVEGIETAEQIVALRALGLGIGQGLIFSPPVTAEDCERLLSTSWHHQNVLALNEPTHFALKAL